jgi:hypothetical protein
MAGEVGRARAAGESDELDPVHELGEEECESMRISRKYAVVKGQTWKRASGECMRA